MHHPWKQLALAAMALIAVALFGCSGDEPLPEPQTTPPPPAEPAVTIAGDHSVLEGQTTALEASTLDGTDPSYFWESADPTIATVDETGVVTAELPGETTIFASGSSTAATGAHPLVVLAEPEPPQPVVTITGDVAIPAGGIGQLEAQTTNGADSGYDWSSGDEAVATVDADGTVSGASPGTVTITAVGVDTGASGSRDLVVAIGPPNYDDWASSGHADYEAEAFVHWDEDDPPEVPTSCARCHSTPGFRDYLGDDGTAQFSVDAAAPVGTVIECEACHNDVADTLTTVVFPGDSAAPGVQVDGLDTASARCITCHQGRESAATVDAAIADAGVSGDDEVSDDLGFMNVHYFPAGSTHNGGRVGVGYEYAGKGYDWRFRHVPGKETCTDCHDPHSLEIDVSACSSCHLGVNSLGDLRDIRMMSSRTSDYDGDGNVAEGVAHEIDGLRGKLLTALRAYTSSQGLGAICYDPGSYPYWFVDDNDNGVCDAGEAAFDNSFGSWTARLVRGTYNYQMASKDPGAFAHNAKYVIQLLHDSIADLDAASGATTLGAAVRDDPGHFDGAAEPARHWDGEGGVSASCSRCHGGSEGYRFFVDYDASKMTSEVGNGLECGTCHESPASDRPGLNLIAVDPVTFPGGATVDFGAEGNVCAVCHAGRQSGETIDEAIADGDFAFQNVHYLAAAAVKAGTNAGVGYEYSGKSYAGPWSHGGESCTFCHDPGLSLHTFDVATVFAEDGCACHSGTVSDLSLIREVSILDYDNDGSSTEPLRDEVSAVAAELLSVIAQYATAEGAPICYDGHTYPYFFNDTQGAAAGLCDPIDATYSNEYVGWDGPLMRAAHNYQISQTEPGAWAHNVKYVLQLLIDSMDDLVPDSSTAAGFIRPAP